MKKTHILNDTIILTDQHGLPAIEMLEGTEVTILHEMDHKDYLDNKAVVIFDGKESMTVAAGLVDEKKLVLKQHQSLCPYHANELWSTFSNETIIMKRVYTKEECDRCKEEF